MASTTTPRNSVGVLAVLGGRVSNENRMSCLKMFDDKNGRRKIVLSSSQFKCMAIPHKINSYNSKDTFLNLHPEVSMLRGSEGNDTISRPRKESSASSITEEYLIFCSDNGGGAILELFL
ncbi:hypothetical protein ACHQM5_003692 [Ranunculus cassubicifolius]